MRVYLHTVQNDEGKLSTGLMICLRTSLHVFEKPKRKQKGMTVDLNMGFAVFP
jgi:hypothetical protein